MDRPQNRQASEANRLEVNVLQYGYLVTTWAIPVIVAITFHEAAHGFLLARHDLEQAKQHPFRCKRSNISATCPSPRDAPPGQPGQRQIMASVSHYETRSRPVMLKDHKVRAYSSRRKCARGSLIN
jgi:hypothetical protein